MFHHFISKVVMPILKKAFQNSYNSLKTNILTHIFGFINLYQNKIELEEKKILPNKKLTTTNSLLVLNKYHIDELLRETIWYWLYPP